MAENPSLQNSSQENQTDGLAVRLEHIETALREQALRLQSLEQQLHTARQPALTDSHTPPASMREERTVANRVETTDTSSALSGSTISPESQNPPSLLPHPLRISMQEEAPKHSGSIESFPSPVRLQTAKATTAQPAQSSSSTETVAARRSGDLETRIAGNWLNRIGILAITFGVAFFLKYAFENQWIGPSGRVLIGIGIGVVALVAGERLRARGYSSYAHGLSGGGILILYLAIYAAFAFYNLIGQPLAFALMALVTATAVLLSARANALPIAILGLIGGFLTPLLLSTGTDNEAALFGYIALLNAGVLALAYFKEWRSLNYMAFCATWLMVGAWALTWYSTEKLWPTLFFITLFFVIFALVAIFHNVIKQRPSRWLDASLIFTNATFYYGASYILLTERYDGTLGLFALFLSGLYAALFYVARTRNGDDRPVVFTFFILAFLFLTLAVAVQFDQQWVTIFWAVEGALLTWMGLRTEQRVPRYLALLAFAAAAVHWLSVDVPEAGSSAAFLPLLNRRAVSCLVLTCALAVAARFYQHTRSSVEAKERAWLSGAFIILANALAVILLSLDASEFFERAKLRGQADSSIVELNRLESFKQLTLSALWTLYGGTMLIIGIVRGSRLLRFAALTLLTLATFKVLALDAAYLAVASWNTLILNESFAANALLTGVLGCAAWFYVRAEKIDEAERNITASVLVVAANLIALIALSAEASNYFAVRIGTADVASDRFHDLRVAEQLSLSVIWTVYGGTMLAVGFYRRNRLLRLLALLLLGVTIMKVFFFDLGALDRFYRVISFVVLGAILLAVSFLYQQRQKPARQE